MHCIGAVNTHGTPVSSMHCTGTGLTRATLPSGWSARRLPTSAARLGASVRRPRLGVAHPAHICAGTERLAACCMVAAGSASDGREWHDEACAAARTLSAGESLPPHPPPPLPPPAPSPPRSTPSTAVSRRLLRSCIGAVSTQCVCLAAAWDRCIGPLHRCRRENSECAYLGGCCVCALHA